MNQTEITKKLENGGCRVSTQFVSLIIRGKRRFGTKKALKAGEIFDVDWTVFLTGTPAQIREALDYRNGA